MRNIFKSLYFKFISANKMAEIIGVHFGANCKFGENCSFGTEPNFIKIGDNFYSSSNVQFITHDGSVNVLRNLYAEHKNIDLFAPIIIGNNVFLGYSVTLLPGTRIGSNVIVGAGSLVKGNLKSDSVYAGVPSKYICSIDTYLKKNKDNFILTKHLNRDDKIKFINNWLSENFEEFDV